MISETSRPIITIDGPAASGKGSITKKIANDFNLYNFETGIFYRILGRKFLEVSNNQNIKSFIKNLHNGVFQIDKYNKNLLYNEMVAKQASKLAKLEVVRSFVLSRQIDTVKNYPKQYKGIILEGRDCGTVIAPDANVKFFLNAKLEIRAKRRYKQLLVNKTSIKYEEILNDLLNRDKNDLNRKHSPLVKAKDATEIDCSNRSLGETIMIVKKIILSKLPNFIQREGNN